MQPFLECHSPKSGSGSNYAVSRLGQGTQFFLYGVFDESLDVVEVDSQCNFENVNSKMRREVDLVETDVAGNAIWVYHRVFYDEPRLGFLWIC